MSHKYHAQVILAFGQDVDSINFNFICVKDHIEAIDWVMRACKQLGLKVNGANIFDDKGNVIGHTV